MIIFHVRLNRGHWNQWYEKILICFCSHKRRWVRFTVETVSKDKAYGTNCLHINAFFWTNSLSHVSKFEVHLASIPSGFFKISQSNRRSMTSSNQKIVSIKKMLEVFDKNISCLKLSVCSTTIYFAYFLISYTSICFDVKFLYLNLRKFCANSIKSSICV